MAGASLSDSDAGPSRPYLVAAVPPTSQHPRIHFPSDSHPHKSSRAISHSVTSSRLDPSFDTSGSRIGGKASRIRVQSVDDSHIYSKSRRVPTTSTGSPFARVSSLHSSESKESDSGSWGLNAFSDEYDLSHEDPRILQDVQRALILKARREARAQAGKLGPPTSKRSAVTPIVSQSNTSPSQPLFPVTSSQRDTLARAAEPLTDIDFSPSTEPPMTQVKPHPVPVSPDDGLTLDWSGHFSDEEKSERRWTLSVSKRKGKEKELMLSVADLKKQKGLHDAKLSRIRTIVSQHTLRKVAITSGQLGHRYEMIYNSLSTGSDFNLAKVVHWYGSLPMDVRSSLAQSEPFTWLKHLEKNSSRLPERSPWHLSAFILKQYVKAQNAHYPMDTIPEIFPPSDGPLDLYLYPRPSGPSFPSPSRASSRFSLDHSLSRNVSAEGRISFEPLTEARASFESQRSAESIFSSVFSGSSAQNRNAAAALPSPASSKNRLRNGPRKQIYNESDGGSSTRNSLVELSDENVHKLKGNNSLKTQSESLQGQQSSLEVNAVVGSSSPLGRAEKDGGRAEPLRDTANSGESTAAVIDERSPAVISGGDQDAPRRIRRVFRISLPSEDRLVLAMEQKRKQEADEARADTEYERKSQLLEQCRASNHRIRSLLNRIATGVKEYEMCQSGFSSSLGLPCKGLPQDLIDAFSHDPAFVTGSTKRLKSYKAVDDIYNRVMRQRAIFKDFVAQQREATSGGGFLTTEDILEDPINSLMQSLDQLDECRKAISEKSNDVSVLLKKTQKIHAEVKSEYYNTASHTSVVYPELSQIVALEESYKDQYQHVWEIGMNALAFILDTVTPFWRTYGKTIGDDVQDFLIIPLYRNEFTGEPKRYPITCLPRRSLRHWVGLILVHVLGIIITLLQIRAAITSAVHYKLSWITYDSIRWTALPVFWVGIVIQWFAVLVELLIVLLQFSTMLWWIGWTVGLLS